MSYIFCFRHTLTMTQVATSVGDTTVNRKGVGSRAVIITTEPGYICDIVTTQEGEMRAIYKRWTDNSISVQFLDGSELVLETKPHPILGLTAPFLAKRTIHLPQDPLENNIEWRRRKRLEGNLDKCILVPIPERIHTPRVVLAPDRFNTSESVATGGHLPNQSHVGLFSVIDQICFSFFQDLKASYLDAECE